MVILVVAAHAQVTRVELNAGAGNSSAVTLSADGRWAIGTASSPTRPMYWNSLGGGTQLPFGASFRAISNGGLVATGQTSATSPNSAMRWTQVTGAASIGSLPGSTGTSNGQEISSDGVRIIGTGETAGTGSARAAFVWTQATGMTVIPQITNIWGVSHQGHAIAGSGNSNAAVLWSEGQPVVTLAAQQNESYVRFTAVTDNGNLAFGHAGGGLVDRTFRWTRTGGAQTLLPNAISIDACTGDGRAAIGSFGTTGYIYFESLGFLDFGQFLMSQGLVTAGTVTPRDISEDGRVILAQWNESFMVRLPRFMTGQVVFVGLAGGVAPPSEALIEFRNPGSTNVLYSVPAELDQFGRFFVTTPDPMGQYDVSVKVSHWLRRTVRVDTAAHSLVTNVLLRLGNGDVDDDNEVGIGDYAALSAVYGSELGDQNWNPMADLNNDLGVDILDYSLLSLSFGSVGDS